MDWNDASEEVVGNFGKIHLLLESFLAKHSAAIKPDIRKAIYGLDRIADQNKFVDTPENVSSTQLDAAEKFLKELSNIEDKFLKYLRE